MQSWRLPVLNPESWALPQAGISPRLFSCSCEGGGGNPFVPASFIMRATVARLMRKVLAIWPSDCP